jgi:hypothetical protein
MHTNTVSRPRTISITKSLSRTIKKEVFSETKEVVACNDIVYGSDIFSLDDVQKALYKISNYKEISAAIKIALTTYPPEIEINNIILPVENSYQQDALKLLKMFIINNLKNELKNKSVDFSTRLVQTKESVRLYITDKDKLERLIEKHPSVLTLIQTFGLELK